MRKRAARAQAAERVRVEALPPLVSAAEIAAEDTFDLLDDTLRSNGAGALLNEATRKRRLAAAVMV